MIKFEIKIEGDASDLQALKNLTAVLGGEVTEVKTTKTEKPVEATKEVETEEPVEGEVVTIEDVRALAKAKARAHKPEIKAKLSELGTNAITNLDPSHYAELAAFLTALA